MKLSFLKNPFVVLAVFLAANVWYAAVFLPGQARKEWESARDELLADGEKLAPTDFAAPWVEDEENFFADPLWRELYERELVTEDGTTYHKSRKPKKEWKVSVLGRPLDGEERKALEERFPEFIPLGEGKNRYGLLHKPWAKAQKAGDTRRASEFVLEALAPAEPVIARLRELGRRPDAYYPLEYQEGTMMQLEHLPTLLSASQWLGLHVSVLLSRGKTAEATEEVGLIFRLAEALNREPAFIVVLSEWSILRMAVSSLNRGILTQAWNERELLEFDQRLARVNVSLRLAEGLRAERAQTLAVTFPFFEAQGADALFSLRAKDEKGTAQDALMRPMFGLYRAYWMPADKIFYAQTVQDWVEALDEAPDDGMCAEYFPNSVEEYFEENPSGWAKARRMLSSLMLSAIPRSFIRGANLQADVHMARVAIALERYRLKHGAYPATLETLVPDFLPELPLDPVAMEPFSYRREDSERFRLWSVGWNETDEGGKAEKDFTEGDWVWGP